MSAAKGGGSEGVRQWCQVYIQFKRFQSYCDLCRIKKKILFSSVYLRKTLFPQSQMYILDSILIMKIVHGF